MRADTSIAERREGVLEYLSKIFDLLKANGWRAAMLAIAAAAFLALAAQGVIPKLDPWMIILAWVVLLTSAALAAAALAGPIQRMVEANIAKQRRGKAMLAAEQKFRDYIPYMTAKERQILGYLLKRKQKTFTAAVDGGYAATLLSLQFVTPIARPGQQFGIDDLPWESRITSGR